METQPKPDTLIMIYQTFSWLYKAIVRKLSLPFTSQHKTNFIEIWCLCITLALVQVKHTSKRPSFWPESQVIHIATIHIFNHLFSCFYIQSTRKVSSSPADSVIPEGNVLILELLEHIP